MDDMTAAKQWWAVWLIAGLIAGLSTGVDPDYPFWAVAGPVIALLLTASVAGCYSRSAQDRVGVVAAWILAGYVAGAVTFWLLRR